MRFNRMSCLFIDCVLRVWLNIKAQKTFSHRTKAFRQAGQHEKRPCVSLYQCRTTSGCRPCAQSNHLPARMWRFIVAFPPVGRVVGGWESCSKRLCRVLCFSCSSDAVSNSRRRASRTSEWEPGGETQTGHLRGPLWWEVRGGWYKRPPDPPQTRSILLSCRINGWIWRVIV